MESRLFRILAMAMLLALAVGTMPALAAKQASIVGGTMYANTGEFDLKLKNWTWDEEIISVKSSAPSVLRVEHDEFWNVWLVPKKVGTAKITLQYKLNGAKKTISAAFAVKKYPNPIKSVTVNKIKVPLKQERKVRFFYDGDDDGKKLKMKINLVPAKAWKTSKIKAYSYKRGNEDGKHTSLTVKNNKQFTIKKDCNAVVTYTLKKGKTTFDYTVYIYRVGE